MNMSSIVSADVGERGKEEDSRRLEVYPPIYRLGKVGRWIREQLLKGILGGNPVLVGLQQLRSPLCDRIMSCVSFLGEEEFYTILIPMVMWLCEARLGRLMVLLMALAFYCTGVLKNLLCLPRPPVPPVLPLHKCQDWGLPSHHALLSVNIPWYLWFYTSRHHSSQLAHWLMAALFSAVVVWSFLVQFSRMYLGVHSPADILTGGVAGCLLLASWLQVDLTVDHFISHSGSSAILIFVAVAMVMLYLHPDPPPPTIIFGETVALVGVAGGVVIGQALGPITVMLALLERNTTGGPPSWLVLCAVLRCVLGFLVLLIVKEVTKVVAKEVLLGVCHLASVSCVYVKRTSEVTYLKAHYSSHFTTLDQLPSEQASQPFKWSSERPLNLFMAVRLLTYTSMGLAIVTFAPIVFSIMGI